MSHPHIPGLDSPRPPPDDYRALRIQVATAGILALPISLMGWVLTKHPDLGACVGFTPGPTAELGSWFSMAGGLVLGWAVLGWFVLDSEEEE
jgi:hypothetical protein